jgi:hypothetical protein
MNSSAPVANYVPYVITGSPMFIFVSSAVFDIPFSFRSPFFFDPSLLTAFISCAGNLIFISGQLCTVDGKIADQHKGKVGTSEGCVTQEEA